MASRYTATWHLTKHKKQITPWILSGNSIQGETIGFAQFEGRKFYKVNIKSYSAFLGLEANR